MKLLLVCVHCTVKCDTLFGVYKLQCFELDYYWCVYSAQCRMKLLFMFLQCTVKRDTVIGVCKVHGAA